MKKVISILLAIVMMVSLCACVSSEEPPKQSIIVNSEEPSETPSAEVDEEPSETPSAKVDEEPTEVESGKVAQIPTIEETVVLEYEGVKVTAKEYTSEFIVGDGLKLLVENNGDKNIGVGCEAVIVNDYMVATFFSTTVAAGKKDNETLYILESDLEAAGITNVGKIEMKLYLYDAESYSTFYTGDMVEVRTSEYENMDTVAENVGTELFNDQGIRIVGKYVTEDSFWGAGILVYIENNTDKDVTISCEDMSVNGFMVDTFFYSSILAGKKAVDEISILSSSLEENDITSIDEIDLVFTAYNSDTFSTIFKSEIIKFSAE